MKLDYNQLLALNAILTYQSFDKAAKELNVSQPAISQRIKALEQYLGQPVIVRANPIKATTIGKKLLVHYRQVEQLENELLPQLKAEASGKPLQVKIATNADSLATWFVDALSSLQYKHNLVFHLQVLNEADTVEKLKDGEVFGAVSSLPKSPGGCIGDMLGSMNYILVATPEFKHRYFPSGVNPEALLHAPTCVFDYDDNLHFSFIKEHFELGPDKYPYHIVRSSEAFINFAKQSTAFCLIPELQIEKELASGELINLVPEKSLVQPLYWHRWALVRGIYKIISNEILQVGQQRLN